MMIVVTGGSSSGKSAFAEQWMMEHCPNGTKYYIATMQSFDAETEKRIAKHRRMRAGKGFETIEAPVQSGQKLAVKIGELPGTRMTTDTHKLPGPHGLLECMSNLVANEMYSPDGYVAIHFPEGMSLEQEDIFVEYLVNEITSVKSQLENLVVVTNNVFEDGIEYDARTKQYLRVLGKTNQKLLKIADGGFEVVVGIPVQLK